MTACAAREEYRLTEQGTDLRPVLIALLAYGDKHLAGSHSPPLLLTHRDCGAPVTLSLECEQGHHVGGPELRSVAGPGARYRRRDDRPRGAEAEVSVIVTSRADPAG